MYCSSAVVSLITTADPPVNEQDSFQTEAAVGNILGKWGVRGQPARKWNTDKTRKSERVGEWMGGRTREPVRI